MPCSSTTTEAHRNTADQRSLTIVTRLRYVLDSILPGAGTAVGYKTGTTELELELQCAGFCREDRRFPAHFGFNAFGGERRRHQSNSATLVRHTQPIVFFRMAGSLFATPLNPSHRYSVSIFDATKSDEQNGTIRMECDCARAPSHGGWSMPFATGMKRKLRRRKPSRAVGVPCAHSGFALPGLHFLCLKSATGAGGHVQSCRSHTF